MSRALLILLLGGAWLAACVHPGGLYRAQGWVAGGAFTGGIEGPVVDRQGNLYAVNYGARGTLGVVVGESQARHFMDLPAGSVASGLALDGLGRLYVADHAAHRLLRITLADRSVEVFAQDARMHQPNDIVLTRRGSLYASDPDWSSGSGQLWYIDPAGKSRLLEAGMGTTNGIALSPDERRLYVNETVQRRVYAYDVLGDGGLANKRLLITFADHGLDGMATDVRGNLYVARYGAGVITVLSPSGEVLREVALNGRFPTNLTFGGKDGRRVFVTLAESGAIESFRGEFAGSDWRRLQEAQR